MTYRFYKSIVLWGMLLVAILATTTFPTYAQDTLPLSPPSIPFPTILFYQGNDSNCDYIAVANGVHAIGGDGLYAYHFARQLVPQEPRDFHEVYYTLLGPNGSDYPFTVDNLGAAPEAFLGMYEALGYDTAFLATTPGNADLDFARALRDRLAANPGATFAHLWTTPGWYNPQARLFRVDETGETVAFPYPYHEVAAIASSDPHSLLILDGLAAAPYTMRLEQVAHQLRGFNRVIVVSTSDSPAAHQLHQKQQRGQPYVTTPLGGLFLTHARRLWGQEYPQWGEVIGLPFRRDDGTQAQANVGVPGKYVWYTRVGAGEVTLVPLGTILRDSLVATGVVSYEDVYPSAIPPLSHGFEQWVIATFGSVDQFFAIFGQPITGELVFTHEQLPIEFPALVQPSSGELVVGVITERAMLVWSAKHGVVLLPLGQILYEWIDDVGQNPGGLQR